MMENRVCKNRKCRKPLPEGYEHRYCENCRTKYAEIIKSAGKTVLGLGIAVGGTALTLVCNGKINNKK